MLKLWHLIAIAIIILISLSFYVDKNNLHTRQDRLQWRIGDPTVDFIIQSFSVASKTKFNIITSYSLIQFLPSLEGHYEIVDRSDANAIFRGMEKPNVTHALLPDSDIPETVTRLIQHKLSTGEYTLVGRDGGYFLIRVR